MSIAVEEKKTHWKKLHNPDYLGAYSLEPGKDMILTIKNVTREMVIGANSKKEECTVLHFIEPQKPMILNVTNSKTISKMYSTPFIEDWKGKQIQVFATMVKLAGDMVEALRIRPTVPQVKSDIIPICEDCKKEITGFGAMNAQSMATYTKQQYKKPLCAECAKALKESTKEENKNVNQ